MQKHIGIFALLLFSLAVNSSAQGDNPYVKSFTAEAIDDKVYLNWTTRAGFTCQDIHILVSTDSLDGYEKKEQTLAYAVMLVKKTIPMFWKNPYPTG